MSVSSNQSQQANQLQVSLDFPDVNDPTFNEQLINTFKRIIDAVNKKDGSLYNLTEDANFQQYFTSNDPNKLRSGYRTSFDLVKLFGGNIPIGTTAMPALSSTTAPKTITGALIPTSAKGAGKGTNGIFYFTDGAINVNFNPTTQVVTVTNNTGVALTSLIWAQEYLKQ